jgi:hypothetical protein
MADFALGFGVADHLGAAAVLCLLALGFLWFVSAGRLFENRTAVYTLCCLHFLLVFFLPWAVHPDCESGSPWWSHLLYTAALATASPVLGGYYASHTQQRQKESFLRRSLYLLFLYACTIAAAADQYLDVTTAAKAWACDSVYWPAIIGTLCGSVCLQGLIAACLVRRVVARRKNQCTYSWIFFILVTAGMNPDNLVFFGEGFGAEHLVLLVGIVAIARFTTEACVEAALESAFAIEQGFTGGNLLLVVTSVTFSGLIAARSASIGLANLCGISLPCMSASPKIHSSAKARAEKAPQQAMTSPPPPPLAQTASPRFSSQSLAASPRFSSCEKGTSTPQNVEGNSANKQSTSPQSQGAAPLPGMLHAETPVTHLRTPTGFPQFLGGLQAEPTSPLPGTGKPFG